MKVAFCTCVQIGMSCIEAIQEMGGRFDLLLTLNDHKSKNKSGRIYLDDLAKTSNTPLFKLNHINDPDVADILLRYEIDWLFIIGWSQIASADLIRILKKGIIGAHPTLLPLGRGRASIPWAIIKGLNRSGVTFFKIDEGVDTGKILDQLEIPITLNETATTLYEKVNQGHIGLIKQIWPKLIKDSIIGFEQDVSLATYWEGRTPADGELFKDMTIFEADKMVRATTRPYPGAFIMLDEKTQMIIWSGSSEILKNSKIIEFIDGPFYVSDFEIVTIL